MGSSCHQNVNSFDTVKFLLKTCVTLRNCFFFEHRESCIFRTKVFWLEATLRVMRYSQRREELSRLMRNLPTSGPEHPEVVSKESIRKGMCEIHKTKLGTTAMPRQKAIFACDSARKHKCEKPERSFIRSRIYRVECRVRRVRQASSLQMAQRHSSKHKKHCKDVHDTGFSRGYVSTKAKATTNDLEIRTTDRMHTVDSGASSHTVDLSYVNDKEKKTLRRSRKILDIQTASGMVSSDTQAKVHIMELGTYLCAQLVAESPSVFSLGWLCNELFYFCFLAHLQGLPRLSRVNRTPSHVTFSHVCPHSW